MNGSARFPVWVLLMGAVLVSGAIGQVYEPALGDKVKLVLASGDTIRGSVVSWGSESIGLQTMFGPMEFKHSQYRRLVAELPPSVSPSGVAVATPQSASQPASGVRKVIALQNGDRIDGYVTDVTVDSVYVQTSFGPVSLPKGRIASIDDPLVTQHSVPIAAEELGPQPSAANMSPPAQAQTSDGKVTAAHVGVPEREGELTFKYGFLYGMDNYHGNMLLFIGSYDWSANAGLCVKYMRFNLSTTIEVPKSSQSGNPLDTALVETSFGADANYFDFDVIGYADRGVKKDIAGEVVGRGFMARGRFGGSVLSMRIPLPDDEDGMKVSSFGLHAALDAEIPIGWVIAFPLSVTYTYFFEGKASAWNFYADVILRPFRSFQNIEFRLGTLINGIKGDDQDAAKMFTLGLTVGFGPLYKSINFTGGTR